MSWRRCPLSAQELAATARHALISDATVRSYLSGRRHIKPSSRLLIETALQIVGRPDLIRTDEYRRGWLGVVGPGSSACVEQRDESDRSTLACVKKRRARRGTGIITTQTATGLSFAIRLTEKVPGTKPKRVFVMLKASTPEDAAIEALEVRRRVKRGLPARDDLAESLPDRAPVEDGRRRDSFNSESHNAYWVF